MSNVIALARESTSKNRAFLSADAIQYMAAKLWIRPDGPPAWIEVEDTPGYDIGCDLTYRMRLRVIYRGRDLTCYLCAGDLLLPTYDLEKHLWDGWLAQFWSWE